MIPSVISSRKGRVVVRVDVDTKRAIRNAADEHAAESGYRFDPERASHVVEFFELHLRHT